MDTNYTTKSQEAISGAMQAAAAAGNPQIEPAHLLVELLSQPDGAAGLNGLQRGAHLGGHGLQDGHQVLRPDPPPPVPDRPAGGLPARARGRQDPRHPRVRRQPAGVLQQDLRLRQSHRCRDPLPHRQRYRLHPGHPAEDPAALADRPEPGRGDGSGLPDRHQGPPKVRKASSD